jgi:uncharacterized repeat protein (TIGR03803 family)
MSALAHAAVFTTLYTFPPGIGPAAADVGLVLDQAGALYGVIAGSQALPAGAIFKYNPATGNVITLYVFSGGADGATPHQTLIFDRAGLLYGTTEFGGDFNCLPGGCGTVFKLDPVTFRLTTLHKFADFNADGAYPVTGALVFGLGGNLYGATEYGGAAGMGTVYSISPAGGTLTTLYASGSGPVGGMAQDATGALYGATLAGGFANAGTLFRLTPPAQGQTVWSATTMYSFTGTFDGGTPLSGLVAGNKGSLFGTTESGGNVHGDGTFFRLVPSTGAFSTLHDFTGVAGGTPFVPLAVDAKFNLYGVTPNGGPYPRKCPQGCGSVYEISLVRWQLTTLYDFAGGQAGERPQSPLAIDNAGALYGTALGGKAGGGIIFKVAPGRK